MDSEFGRLRSHLSLGKTHKDILKFFGSILDINRDVCDGITLYDYYLIHILYNSPNQRCNARQVDKMRRLVENKGLNRTTFHNEMLKYINGNDINKKLCLIIKELEDDPDKFMESYDVNKRLNNGLRLFDYILIMKPIFYDDRNKLFLKIFNLFMDRKDLVLSIHNIIMIGESPDDINIYKIIYDERVKKFEYYQIIMHTVVRQALHYHEYKMIEDILSIEEYDMRYMEKFHDHLFIAMRHCNLFKNKYKDDIRKFLEKITLHNSFRITNNMLNVIDKIHNSYIKEEFNRSVNITMTSQLFLLLAGYSDDYFIKDKSHRFFEIAETLPMELQMILANYTYGNYSDIILQKYINQNIHILDKN